jgi:uncharacterized repeat protein (TIGR01451 family)
MNWKKLWTLFAGPGLAVASLLLLFLLLGYSTAGATPDVDDAIPGLRPPSATFTVSGTVTCAATGPISDVEVFVWDRDGGSGGFRGNFTGSAGYYSVTLQQGHYDLLFHPPCGSGCASTAYKGISGPPDVTLNVVLSPGHTVSGTVTDGSAPVEGVAIYAFNRDTADGFGLPPTDEHGHYCIDLITGTYDIGFTPLACRGLGPRTVTTPITQDTFLTVTLPLGFTVAGCVTDESGNPVSGVQIYAKDPNIGGFGFAPTNESGCYTGTLQMGTYDIQFIPPPWRGLGSVTITDVVSTTPGCPNATLPITLPAGFTLSGRVTCNDAGIGNVFVYAEPEGPPDPDNSLPGYGVFTVDDGSYWLPVVPGTYNLEYTPPAATKLNARAFTTTEIVTDTVLNVDFCICTGIWISETVDSVGDTGYQSSLALAPTYPYTPHIGYHNATSQSLKHARLSGTIWFSDTVDPHGGWKAACRNISLALVSIYPHTPCIAYHDRAYWGVWFAYWDGTAWISDVVEGGHFQGDGGVSLALEPVDPYTPHISYNLPWNVDGLMYASLSGTAWMSHTWVITTVDSDGAVGSCNSLALEQTYPYTSHISYYDGDNGDLKYAWWSGTTWLSETVDSDGEVGRWSTSLALDSGGDPHISYLDSTNLYNFDLKYAWLSGTTWLTDTVDSEGDVGWFTSLALDGHGNPHISYCDRANSDLKYARFDGRIWIIQTVDSVGVVDSGMGTSLVLDKAGCPHISYHDGTSKDLKYARIPPLTDVAIVKSSHAPMVTWGDRLTYTLRLTNTGDAHLHAVITDTLPAHVTPTGVLTWTPPVICPGDPWTQTVVVTVEMGYAGPLTNEVEVATREGAAGEASATVYVEPRRIYLPLVFKSWAQGDSSTPLRCAPFRSE